eukprot:GFUD01000205.1.p1 GENE.GFUD01000205.1~~GFUD01000205.1.p1  ORF type:complete len:826 (+),score=182.40 GFUD01000205.1:38-2515(+)
MSSDDIVPTVTQVGESSYFNIPEQFQENYITNVSPRKNTSPSWKFFDRISKLIACCKLCGIQVPIKHGSTAGLFSHLKNKHPSDYHSVKVDTMNSGGCFKPRIIKPDLSDLLIPETRIKQEENNLKSLITSKAQDSILEYIADCRTKDNNFTDVVFHCKDGEVRAHKIVLASVSEYLKHVFMSSDQEEEHLLMDGFTSELISDFLNDLYKCQNFVQHEDVVSALFIHKPGNKDWKWKRKDNSKEFLSNCDTSDNEESDLGVKLEASDDSEPEIEQLKTRLKSLKDIAGSTFGETNSDDSPHQNDAEFRIKSVPGLTKSPKIKGTKKKRSQVWQHFTKDEGDCSTCSCHHCERHIASHGGSTSAMMKHLVINHPEVLDLRVIPDKYKLLNPVLEDSKIGIIKHIPHINLKNDNKCAVCDIDLATTDLTVLHQHMEAEHSEVWNKEGIELRLVVRERSERVELCFMMGEIENNMVCRLCQTVVNRSEMAEHLRGEHSEFQPTLSIYYTLEEESLAKCDLCGVNGLDIDDVDSHMEGNHPEICETICLLRQILVSDSDEMNIDERVVLETFAKHINLIEISVGKPSAAIDSKFKVKHELPYKLSADGKTCGDCGKVYVSKSSCRLHWRAVHSGLRPFECEKCGNTFTRKDSYDSHMTMHENSQPFMCSECGKTFNRRHARDQHERAHRGDFRFACSFCGRKFLSGQQMRGHERTHTGEKPFQCSQCGRQFVQKHQLVTHFRTHTGEKPYQCARCKQWFKHLSSRRNHKCEPVEPVVMEEAGNSLNAPERHRLEMMEKMKQHFSNTAGGATRDVTDPIMRLSFNHPDFK